MNRVEYRSRLEDSELSVGQITGFMDQLIDNYGLERVGITGGEALLNKVWPRTRPVLEHALDRGMEVQLNTSGSGQVPMRVLAEAARGRPGQLFLQVSLDGLDEERVNRFRGHAHAMQWANRTLEEAIANNLVVWVRFTATTENSDEAIDLYDHVANLGVDRLIVRAMMSTGTAKEHADLALDTVTPIQELQQKLLDRSAGNATKLQLLQPSYVAENDGPQDANVLISPGCSCGHELVYLSTEGDLYPCVYTCGEPDSEKYVLGNIADPMFDFDQAWNDPLTWPEYRSAAREANCTTQNLSHATASLETDDLRSQWVALSGSTRSST